MKFQKNILIYPSLTLEIMKIRNIVNYYYILYATYHLL